MTSVGLFIMTLFLSFNLSSCSDEAAVDSVSTGALTRAGALPVVTISAGLIPVSNLNWTANNVYQLDGKVAVPVGQTLTIAAGTTVIGLTKSSAVDASALIVPRGAKIEAIGTASEPIVMTASNETKGGWGGIVLLGKAPINQIGDVYIEGIDTDYLPAELQDVDFRYGGSTPADDSGILQYVRVEYAGAAISEANELNAFTFGGVGSGTTVDHCQAYYGADDAFEFFGGCVNAKYLVSTATDDDAFDFDFGYSGKIQFAVATIDASMTYSKDPNGIECDNDGNSSSLTPYTRPVLSNLTIVGTVDGQVAGIASGGTALKSAANFRRNTQFELHNSILYGFPAGVLNQTSNSFVCNNNIVAATTAGNEFVGFTPSASNVATTVGSIGLSSPWGGYAGLKPTAAPANTGADFSNLDTTWFTTTTYRGAVASGLATNWLTVGSWVR
jgi:hypothetical protein